MDKRLLRYAGGGGAISLLACGLLCMALGALAGGDVAGLVACGVIFALPGVVSVTIYTPFAGDSAAGPLNDSAPYHSLRLRRRECARPPLSEKIIIKPLKKVEDHLWKLENPE